VHYRQRTPNALDALVSSEQIRFDSTSEAVSTDRQVPDEIRERVPDRRAMDSLMIAIVIKESMVRPASEQARLS